MGRRSVTVRALFMLCCVLDTAFSVPTTEFYPPRNEEPRYTTRRISNIKVDLANMRYKSSPPSVNQERITTTTTSTTSTTSTTTTMMPRVNTGETPLYRLDGSNGQACILLQVDALLTIKYRTKLGEDEEADIYVPDNAIVTGNCENQYSVTMSLKWKTYVLSWSFAKTPGGERWYVEKIELTYNSSDNRFKHIDQPNKTIRVSSAGAGKHSNMFFPTPVGKSYFCPNETDIKMTDGKHHASVLLRNMKLQPFKFKTNEFAPEFSCTALSARGARDETAPVAVGSTLAAATLLIITGYAGWRYFKVKKVKYDTME